MIADAPGNCLTPEEHANVALLGQARSRWDNSAFREVECSPAKTLFTLEPRER